MANDCFKFSIKLVLGLGASLFLAWIFSQIPAKKPTCSIEQFDVFALNKTSNHTLYFNLKLKNRSVLKGVFYEDLNVTFSYALNRSFPVATATFPAFRQGNGHSARRTMLLPAAGVDWPAVKQAAEKTGSAAFRVDLSTRARFSFRFLMTKRHRLEVGAVLSVNRLGNLVTGKKGVKLTSAARTERRCYRAPELAVVLVLVQYFIWPSNARF